MSLYKILLLFCIFYTCGGQKPCRMAAERRRATRRRVTVHRIRRALRRGSGLPDGEVNGGRLPDRGANDQSTAKADGAVTAATTGARGSGYRLPYGRGYKLLYKQSLYPRPGRIKAACAKTYITNPIQNGGNGAGRVTHPTEQSPLPHGAAAGRRPSLRPCRTEWKFYGGAIACLFTAAVIV